MYHGYPNREWMS